MIQSGRFTIWQQDEHEISLSDLYVRCQGFGRYVTESGLDVGVQELDEAKLRQALEARFPRRVLDEIRLAAQTGTALEVQAGGNSLEVVPPTFNLGVNDRYGGYGTSRPLKEIFAAQVEALVLATFGRDVWDEVLAQARVILARYGSDQT